MPSATSTPDWRALMELLAEVWDAGLEAGARWTPTQWGDHKPQNPYRLPHRPRTPEEARALAKALSRVTPPGEGAPDA